MKPQQPLDSLAGIILALQAGESVPYSRMSVAVRKRAKSLFDTGALVAERKGGGHILVISNTAAFNGFVKAAYPGGLVATDIAGEGKRTRGVRLYGNSKKSGSMDMEIVVFRRTAYPTPPFLTGKHEGLALGAFVLSINSGASFSGRVATVENHEQFAKYDWAAAGFDAVILTSGRASNRLVAWLASDSMKGAQYTHFGDYDPVGLDEFARMHKKLGARVRLFVPDNIETLFAHKKLKLVEDSGKLLLRLSKLRHAEIERVLRLIREHGGGLEQESLLISSEPLVA